MTRVVATAVAMLYIANCTGHLGYSWATTEASVHVNVAWPDGKEPLLKLPAKNFPSPLPMYGRSRLKINFMPPYSRELLIAASAESTPVRCAC